MFLVACTSPLLLKTALADPVTSRSKSRALKNSPRSRGIPRRTIARSESSNSSAPSSYLPRSSTLSLAWDSSRPTSTTVAKKSGLFSRFRTIGGGTLR